MFWQHWHSWKLHALGLSISLGHQINFLGFSHPVVLLGGLDKCPHFDRHFRGCVRFVCRPWIHVLNLVQRARQHQQEANEVSPERLNDKLVHMCRHLKLHAFPTASFLSWICPPFCLFRVVFLVSFSVSEQIQRQSWAVEGNDRSFVCFSLCCFVV